MPLSGPLNYQEIPVEHAATGGSDGSFAPTMDSSGSSYLPRWDYGGGVVDSGTAPAARAVGTTTGTTVTIGFCTFAQGNINVSDMGITATGVNNLLQGLVSANPSSINYEAQDRYSNADNVNTQAGTDFTALQNAGWTRSGTYETGDLALTVLTTTASETMTIPFQAGTYACEIDWGDGSVDQYIASNSDGRLTHTYAAAGTYAVTIRGTAMTNLRFSGAADRDKVQTVTRFDTAQLQANQLVLTFHDCDQLTSVSNMTVTNACTQLLGVFNDCALLQTPDVSSWDVSAVTTMNSLFRRCPSFATPPAVGSWVTTSCTDMSSMFNGMSGITDPPDVSGFSTAGVGNMSFMFTGLTSCTTSPDVSGFDTSSVSNLQGMFGSLLLPTVPPDVSGFVTNSVTNMQGIFQNCRDFLTPPDVSGWNTSAVTNMSFFFQNCFDMNAPDVAGFTTTNVTTMESMFQNGFSMTTIPDVSGFDTSSCTNFNNVFNSCNVATAVPVITGWNWGAATSVVETFANMNAAPANAAFFDAFLIDLDNDNTGSGTLKYSDAADGTAILDTSRSAAADFSTGAGSSLIGKGWARTGSY